MSVTHMTLAEIASSTKLAFDRLSHRLDTSFPIVCLGDNFVYRFEAGSRSPHQITYHLSDDQLTALLRWSRNQESLDMPKDGRLHPFSGHS